MGKICVIKINFNKITFSQRNREKLSFLFYHRIFKSNKEETRELKNQSQIIKTEKTWSKHQNNKTETKSRTKQINRQNDKKTGNPGPGRTKGKNGRHSGKDNNGTIGNVR